MASDVSACAVAAVLISGASDVTDGAPPVAAGRLGGATNVRGIPLTPGVAFGVTAAISGALGSATGASLRGRAPAGGVYCLRCGRAPVASKGNAFGSTTVAVTGASGNCSIA